MALITPAEYPEIRAVLDTSLTSTQVPDAMIEYSIYLGRAEREIIGMYPSAQTVVTAGTDTAAIAVIKRATIYLVAALLAPAIPRLLKEHLGIYNYTRKMQELDEQVDYLRGMVESELSTIVDIAFSDIIPTLFTVARGNRGV